MKSSHAPARRLLDATRIALTALLLSAGCAAWAAQPAATAASAAAPKAVAAAKSVKATAAGKAAAAAPAISDAARAHADKALAGIGALHKKADVTCNDCHGDKVAPNDNETVENAACVECHGDYAKLARKTATKLKNKDINPHGSHLGPEIACTACHASHTESQAYCSNCHTNFVMPMAGNPKR